MSPYFDIKLKLDVKVQSGLNLAPWFIVFINLGASTIVKYLRHLFNLDSLYPELHLTIGGWEGGRLTVWTRFYWVQWELLLGCLPWGTRPGEQLQTVGELWPWRTEEKQKSREGKACPYRRAKALCISPKNVCYRAGGWNEKGICWAWHRRQSDYCGCPRSKWEWLHRLHCTVQIPLLFPHSVPKDTVYLLCKGYRPKPGAKLWNWEHVPFCRLWKRGHTTAAGRTDPCFHRGCWGTSWEWRALEGPKGPAPGYWATHRP